METALSLDKLEKRVKQYEAYAKADPQNGLIWLTLGDLYHQQSRFDEARGCYEKCLALTPETNAARSRLASIFISQHRFDDAEAKLRELIATGDDDPAVLHNLGLSLYYQKRWQEAETCFEQAHARGVSAPECFAYLSRCRHYAGDMQRAIEWCQQWVDARRDADGQGYLALLHMDNGNMAEAEPLARATLARSPHNADAAIVAGTASVERQEIKEAAAWFKRVVERQPDNARAWLGIGLVHMYLQQHEQAVEALQRARQLIPENSGTVVTLGWAKLAMRDISGAERVFREAVEVDRNFAESHGGLAVALAMQGKVDAAREAIKVATRLDSRGFGAAFAQSILLKLRGQDERATRLVAALLEQAPTEGARPLIEHIRDFLRTRVPPA